MTVERLHGQHESRLVFQRQTGMSVTVMLHVIIHLILSYINLSYNLNAELISGTNVSEFESAIDHYQFRATLQINHSFNFHRQDHLKKDGSG